MQGPASHLQHVHTYRHTDTTHILTLIQTHTYHTYTDTPHTHTHYTETHTYHTYTDIYICTKT